MNFPAIKKVGASRDARWIAQRALIGFVAVIATTLVARAQTPQTPDGESGQILGTVTDVRGDAVPGATVILTGPGPTDEKTVVTGENGFFEFDNVRPGVSYQAVIRASGFAEWTSPAITLAPGQGKLLEAVSLRLAAQNTTMTVTDDPIEIATEQIRAEETQRVFGFLPNFYVSYEGHNAAPLTAKMKFQLALKVAHDPVTIAGVAFVAGIRQAVRSPNYPEGAKGYGERFGAVAGDGFSDIIIGGAILPSLLHEDPRYFYQGTGTTKSRLLHAISSPFVSKRDNGSWGPNYSSLGGDLASGAIANLYFPKSNRGVGLVFSQFALGTVERIGASLAQEFVLSKLTRRGGHIR